MMKYKCQLGNEYSVKKGRQNLKMETYVPNNGKITSNALAALQCCRDRSVVVPSDRSLQITT